MRSLDNNITTPRNCKVKRSYSIAQQCKKYDPAKCGNRIASSFVDLCPTCKTAV